jgi:hypothetical protein
MIEKIVEAVIEKLGRTFSGSADDLIGIQPHIEALENLLKLRSEDDSCRVLGIWGMDGIGKTTLATVLYDKISYQFDACCFIENVSKIYEDGGAVSVQKQIICQTIEEKNIDTCSPRKISQTMRNRLCKLKLLIVLDNVEQLEQLEELDIEPKFLHPRSKIIIVTRDKHILQAYGVDKVFEAKLMNDEDAYKLVFYDVDPSHVKKQNGVYENAFVLHTETFKHDSGKVARWRTTMTDLGGTAGWDVRNE